MAIHFHEPRSGGAIMQMHRHGCRITKIPAASSDGCSTKLGMCPFVCLPFGVEAFDETAAAFLQHGSTCIWHLVTFARFLVVVGVLCDLLGPV
jgi:hypothetical protein